MFSSIARSYPHKFLKTLTKGIQRAASSCGKTLNIVMAALTTIYSLLPNSTLHTGHTAAMHIAAVLQFLKSYKKGIFIEKKT